MKITQEQFVAFLLAWARPFGDNARFQHMRFGQAFMNYFGISKLDTPFGDAWNIHDKKQVADLCNWIMETMVEG